MGHAEVAQSPGERRDDGDEREVLVCGEPAFHQVAELSVHGPLGKVGNLCRSCGRAADRDHHDGDCQEQRDEHERSLNEVGRTDGGKAAEQGVEQDDDHADDQTADVGKVKDGVQQLCAGDEARRRVDDEEEHDEDGGNQGDDPLFVVEAVRQELGNRNRVPAHLRVAAERLCNDKPVEVGSYFEAQCGPEGLLESSQIGDAGQAHQKPAGHVARLGRKGRRPGAQVPSPQEEILRAVVRVHPADAHVNHEAQIEGKGDNMLYHRRRHRAVLLVYIKLPYFCIFMRFYQEKNARSCKAAAARSGGGVDLCALFLVE